YQVEVTVVRLLDLGEDDLLELERGEDIDVISRVLDSDLQWAEGLRVLEQIKTRSRDLTLRTPSARTAVANFHAHRTSNPGRRLRFRFTTNAGVTVERPSPFPDEAPGIEIWEALRRGGFGEGLRAERLAGVRQLLTSESRPEDCPPDVWASFQLWLASAQDEALLAFVADFE